MPTEPRHPNLSLDLVALGRILVIATAVIFALCVARELLISRIGTDTVLQDLRHFALDSERSVPAWYSSLLMTGCAALLLLTARLTRRDGGADAPRWSLLALIFLLMALDESASFHEVLITPLREQLGTSGIFYFAWVIPGSVVLAALGLYFLPFLLRLGTRSTLLFAAAGLTYVGGAFGFELVAGGMADAYGLQSTPYLVAAVIEEGLEMAGLTGFLLALVDHLGRHWPAIGIDVAAGVRSRKAAADAVPAPAE